VAAGAPGRVAPFRWRSANVAWLLQAFFLVADDMMDHSITRRGQPCWYKVEKVGLNACNDCIVLEACIYKILKKHVRKLPCYLPVRVMLQPVRSMGD